MKPLSIDKALRLYNLLAPYLPELSEAETGVDFVGKIIENIKASGKHQDYITAVALMMGTTDEDIIGNMTSAEVLESFFDGFNTNKVLFLQEFCTKVGLNG